MNYWPCDFHLWHLVCRLYQRKNIRSKYKVSKAALNVSVGLAEEDGDSTDVYSDESSVTDILKSIKKFTKLLNFLN